MHQTYRILSDAVSEHLAHAVTMGIADGWHPCGGVCVANVPDEAGVSHVVYYQAMTR